MKEDKYIEASTNLAKAIDIAIDSFKKHPPKFWDDKTLNHVINCYIEWKEKAINTEKKYRNIKSLSYVVNDVFTNFQESTGVEIEYFWAKIKENNLPYKRENKLLKILKRKKIKNDIEYDFVIDVLVPYQQEGLITKDELILLNSYISDFELKNKKK